MLFNSLDLPYHTYRVYSLLVYPEEQHKITKSVDCACLLCLLWLVGLEVFKSDCV